MKKIVIFTLALLLCGSAFSQKLKNKDTTYYPGKFVIEASVNWGYLAKIPDYYTQKSRAGLSVSVTMNFHLIKFNEYKKVKNGLSLLTGIGYQWNTFNSNTILNKVGGIYQFDKIQDFDDYKYSYFGLGFIEIPHFLRITTNPKEKNWFFTLDLGGKFGILTNSSYGYQKKIDKTTTTVTTSKIDNLNIIRYGVSSKIGFNFFTNKNKPQSGGTSLIIYGDYYLTDTFKENKGPSFNYFIVGFGLIELL